MIELKGMAWDHPRGYEPLRAASKEFSKLHLEVSIKWDVRSLKEFGDMPIESLIERYDLITIDHPYMGQADKNGLLQALESHISKASLNKLEEQSVGPSFKSYQYNNHIYALPIDAAALVGAYRNDIVENRGLVLPKTKEELKRFYCHLPNDLSIAWALCPTDFWCTFLTLCAQSNGRDFINGQGIDLEIGIRVLDEIKSHLDYLHPRSMEWNPIQILDHMGANDDIVYSPYLFGYTNYSRLGYAKNLVHFCNSPQNKEGISTILGGVGLAVSSHSSVADLAAKFVEFVAGEVIQEGIFTDNGGQPGNLRAWTSSKNNELCNNFFKDTLHTLETAYVRPQFPGWNQFQEQGADMLHAGVAAYRNSRSVIKNLNELYQTII
ncbi:ABC transporter substrate-binding protein [Carboxylicivirga sp. N1Y90]|uniref:ABC transporter substrate-binding protein n=1 Tax=Carboxylicivirga fragile TaxID=3417571 RepID=UPI003D328FAE|nr:carbohydrate ABC transporter substrate-binding protein [Marinilabiliaceae bacterium N1Y90]